MPMPIATSYHRMRSAYVYWACSNLDTGETANRTKLFQILDLYLSTDGDECGREVGGNTALHCLLNEYTFLNICPLT